MAVKLHRCSLTWFKMGIHPCWRVQKALDEKGIEYEVVKGPARKGSRTEMERLTQQGSETGGALPEALRVRVGPERPN